MARPSNADLKKALNRRFPSTAFRVHSGRGTSACWSHVGWTDGPSESLVVSFLATLGAAPGHSDQSDYFDGERVSVTRHLSDDFRLMVARSLVGNRPLPAMETWHKDIRQANGTDWYSFRDCVYRAAVNRTHFENERFQAVAWMNAMAHGKREAPTLVVYA